MGILGTREEKEPLLPSES